VQAGFHEHCRATEPPWEQRGRLDVVELLDGVVLDQPFVSISPSDSAGSTPSTGSEVEGAKHTLQFQAHISISNQRLKKFINFSINHLNDASVVTTGVVWRRGETSARPLQAV
jgi:hypothetical protein